MTDSREEPDSYTVAEAARLISRTPKRVRQMITEGKFHPVEGATPVRIPAREVIAAREEARKGRTGPAPGHSGLTAAQVLALVESLTAKALESAQASHRAANESRDRSENILRDAFAEERVRRTTAEAERDRALAELAALREAREAQPRKWWAR